MKPSLFLYLLATLVIATACNQDNGSKNQAITDATKQNTLSDTSEDTQATEISQLIPTEEANIASNSVVQNETNIESESASATPTNSETVEQNQPELAPIEVTYITPGQGEGPYYPIDKPDDQDNDLTNLAGADGEPAGQVIEFGGVVYDSAGVPTPGIVVEIWQTDDNGVYLHPNDPGTEQRDRNFQFYGEAVTNSDGRYSFRTILPGHYEPRPRHIHVKVKYEGQELLTTQFYFAGDPELADEAMFNQVEGDGVHLIISLAEGQDTNGNPILVGLRDIILNVDLYN